MKESLAEAGVPAERVVCDYAGFRTLDSVVRAKKVFGLDSFIVVSQKDQVRRAVFTARGFGCNAYGYAAPDVNGRYSIKTTIREQLAKIAAVLDVILRRGPKFLGPREPLPDGKAQPKDDEKFGIILADEATRVYARGGRMTEGIRRLAIRRFLSSRSKG